jgi:hypothetical protein
MPAGKKCAASEAGSAMTATTMTASSKNRTP